MAGRVDESDFPAVLFDLIGADMLSDAASLAFNHLGLANGIQQRCLAVIDVAHDRDDRRARLQITIGIGLGKQAFLDI